MLIFRKHLQIPDIPFKMSSDGIKAWNVCEFYEELLLNECHVSTIATSPVPVIDPTGGRTTK